MYKAEYDENNVLCSASAYTKKYYLGEKFGNLPEKVKKELQVMCVTFTESVGGVIVCYFDKEGELKLTTEAYEEDIMYDGIESELRIRKLIDEKQELFGELSNYYKVFFMEIDGEGE